MEVRPGYKQTEVGVIPIDWHVKRLGDIGECIIGLTYKPANVKSNGLLVLRASNIRSGGLAFDDNVFVDVDVPDRIIVRKDDILICVRSGSRELIGKCALIDESAEGMTFGAFMSVFRTGHARFVFHQFQSDLVKKQIQKNSGATINQITNKNLNSFQIPIPATRREEEAIAAALSDVDTLISALDKLIAKKRDIKQAAMQQLLTGKKRLPGFSGEWEVRKLGDVSAIKTGKKNNEDKVENGAYPFFVRSQTVERINTYSYDGEAVLVPGEGGIGSIFHYINGRFDYHQRVYKISDFISDVCGKFIYYCTLQNFNKQAMRNSVKATVDSLRLPTFQGFEFLAPSFDEQQAIAAVLSDMDAEIAALEQRRDKTRALKQGMMQELLTGRIRLV